MKSKKLLLIVFVVLAVTVTAAVCTALLLRGDIKTSKPWDGDDTELQDVIYADGLVYFATQPTVGFTEADIRTYTIMTEEELDTLQSNLAEREWGSTAFTNLVPSMPECPLDLSFYNGGWHYVSFKESLLYKGGTYYKLTDTDLQFFRELQKRAKTLKENSPIYTDTVTYSCLCVIPIDDLSSGLPGGGIYDGINGVADLVKLTLTKSDRTFTYRAPFTNSDAIAGTYTLTKDRLTLHAEDGTDRTYVFSRKGYGFAFDANASSVLPAAETVEQADNAPSVSDGAVFLPRNFLFDLDGDGKRELIEFRDGGTSGIVSYRLWVSRNSIPVYSHFLPMMQSYICFVNEDGKLQNGSGVVMDLAVRDGELIFLYDGKEVDEFPPARDKNGKEIP